MKKILCIVIVLVSCVLFSSCSSKEEPAQGRIGVTFMDLTNPFFKLIANVMEEEAAKYGYQIVALSAEIDPAKQNSQMNDFAAQNYDAVFVNAVDSKAIAEGIKKVHQAGIPIFTFDIPVTDEQVKDMVVSHIGSDNYQGGRLAGESMMKATGDKGQVAIIGYPETEDCLLRVKGFKDYLKEHNSQLTIATELSGKGSRNEGYAVATDILQSHPDIVGIFAINDPSALGAYSAVTKAGKTGQISIVGFDASPAGKQAIFEKKLFDSPQQFPRKMAKGTIEAFIKYLDGEQVEKNVIIACSHYYYQDSVNDENRIAEQW